MLNLAYKINIDIIETTEINQRLPGKNTLSFKVFAIETYIPVIYTVFLKKFSNGQKEQTLIFGV